MKRLFSILIVAFSTACIYAGDSLSLKQYILDDMPNVQVRQDSLLEKLLHDKIFGTSELIEIDGYRVQIYSSNLQQTAKTEALQLEKEISEEVSVPVYVLYLPPFWKVRLGNFRTFDEANKYKSQFITQHPTLQGDTYIVRDKIQVTQ